MEAATRDHVNAIVPGIIGRRCSTWRSGDERADRNHGLERPGEPQDIANAIAFLCSDLAAIHHGGRAVRSGGVELFVF